MTRSPEPGHFRLRFITHLAEDAIRAQLAVAELERGLHPWLREVIERSAARKTEKGLRSSAL
jgi:hypothetical protein